MNECKRLHIYSATASNGSRCEIQEYESESELMRWRIYQGVPGCPWLEQTEPGAFIDRKTGITYSITDR